MLEKHTAFVYSTSILLLLLAKLFNDGYKEKTLEYGYSLLALAFGFIFSHQLYSEPKCDVITLKKVYSKMIRYLVMPYMTTLTSLVIIMCFLMNNLEIGAIKDEFPFFYTFSVNFKDYFAHTTTSSTKLFDYLSVFCLLIQLNTIFPVWFYLINLLPSPIKFLILSTLTVGLFVIDNVISTQWNVKMFSYVWPLFLGQIAYELTDQKLVLPFERQKSEKNEENFGVKKLASNPIVLAPFGLLFIVFATIFIPNPLPFYIQKLFLLTIFTFLLVFGKKFDFGLVENWLFVFTDHGIKPILVNCGIVGLWRYQKGWDLELDLVENGYAIIISLLLSYLWRKCEDITLSYPSEKPGASKGCKSYILLCFFFFITLIFIHSQLMMAETNEAIRLQDQLQVHTKEFGVFKKHLKNIYDGEVVVVKSKEFNLKMNEFGALERNQSRGKFYSSDDAAKIVQRTIPGKGKLRMLVLGDTMAQQLVYGIQQNFMDKFALLFSFSSSSSCPPYSTTESSKECHKFAGEVVNMMKKNRFDVIFVVSRMPTIISNASETKRLQEFYLSLENYAKELLFMVGVPLQLPFNGFVENQKTLERRSLYKLKRLTAISRSELHQFEKISCQKCVKFTFPEAFCDESKCSLYENRSRIPYYDNTESLSLYGSLKVASNLRSRYDQFMKNSAKNYLFKARSNGTLTELWKIRK